jgi:hypothetical protein
MKQTLFKGSKKSRPLQFATAGYDFLFFLLRNDNPFGRFKITRLYLYQNNSG